MGTTFLFRRQICELSFCLSLALTAISAPLRASVPGFDLERHAYGGRI
jgi:hypothetical protein